MSKIRKNARKPGRVGKNYFVTKSGSTIKLHRSLGTRLKAYKDTKSQRKAANLSTLPKGRIKRFFARFEPKRMYHYWFSRQGAIMGLKILGIGMVAGFLVLVGLFSYFRKDLPNLKDISGTNLGGSITYYDRTGQTLLWEDYSAIKRTPVKDDQISQYMKDATVAVEDKDFFKHGGFDVRGIARAGLNDAFGTGGTQGGSTITQQVVKLNQSWTTDRSITRKIKELILAVELEREYSKTEILNGYLNVAPYGGVDYGVETAARDYFGTSAKDLNLAQSAMLAAIPKAPTAYSPFSNPQYNPGATANLFNQSALISRQHYILDQMASQGKITKAQAEEAKKVDIIAQVHTLQDHYNGIKAPYFVLAAKTELNQKYGEVATKRGGWKVITTLDMGLQKTAEDLVSKNVSNISNLTRGVADEEALVAEDVATGQIVSLVGGTDFNNVEHGKINYAASALIPPGSSFKPYDYATFIDNNNNVGAGSVLYDNQVKLPGYECDKKGLPPPKGNSNCLQDYDFLNPGPITLRYALGGSRNIPAVKAMLSAVPNDTSDGKVNSINKVISTASAMMANPYNDKPYQCYNQGVDIANATPADVTQCYGASAIGDGAFLHLDDHVNGLSTMSRLGSAIPRTYIMKISDTTGKTVSEWTQPKGKQVLKPDAAYIVNDMASDGNASYLPGSYKFQNQPSGWRFAVKTGTTNNGFDGLMTSWSTKYAVVTWVGNHTRNKELHTSMEYLTEPLARGWMEAAHKGLKPVNWAEPAGLKHAPAFIVRNHIHYGDVEPSPATDLFPSWYQGKTDNKTNQTIDKVSKKTATSCTPDAAKDNQANGNANSFSVDIFVAGGSASTGGAASGNDDVHKCDDAKPSISVTASGCDLVATVTQGTHPLSSGDFPGVITFLIGGQPASTANVSESPSTVTYTVPTGTTSATAKITDSVLYEASADVDVSCATPATPAAPTPLTGLGHTGGTYTWSGGSGTVTVYKTVGGSAICSAAATTGTCAGSPPPGSGYSAKDDTGAVVVGT